MLKQSGRAKPQSARTYGRCFFTVLYKSIAQGLPCVCQTPASNLLGA
jgi:hypothetical protein